MLVEPVVYCDPFGTCACSEHAQEGCSVCPPHPAPLLDTFFPAHVAWTLLRTADSQFNTRSASVQRRKDEFLAGRRAAYSALRKSGFQDQHNGPVDESHLIQVIRQNADRSPGWPAGYVGSISHSHNWVMAVAAKASDYRSLGVDSEAIVGSAQAELLRRDMGQAAEWDLLSSVGLPMPIAFTLLFSAKESFYKSWYPLHTRFLNFDDVVACHIEPEPYPMRGSVHSGLIHLQLNQVDTSKQPVRYCITAHDVFTLTTIDSE